MTPDVPERTLRVTRASDIKPRASRRPGQQADVRSVARFACDGCGRDVTGSPDAVLHVRNSDIEAHAQARAEWESSHLTQSPAGVIASYSLAAMLDLPERASWLVHCSACNPHDDDCWGCYWFSLDRCHTAAKLLDWTSHLMSKSWLSDTDWQDLIQRVANQMTKETK